MIPKFVTNMQFNNRPFILIMSIIAIMYHIIAFFMFTHLGKLQLRNHIAALIITMISLFSIMNNLYLFVKYDLGEIKNTILISTLLSIMYINKIFSGSEFYDIISSIMIVLMQILMIILNFSMIKKTGYIG